VLITSHDPVAAQNEKKTPIKVPWPLILNQSLQCWVIAPLAQAARLRALRGGRSQIPSPLQSWQGKRHKQTNRKTAPSWSRGPRWGNPGGYLKLWEVPPFSSAACSRGSSLRTAREGVAARPVIISWKSSELGYWRTAPKYSRKSSFT